MRKTEWNKLTRELEMSTETKSVRARRMISEMETALLKDTVDTVEVNFQHYKIEFPSIFNMILKRDYKKDLLEMMLKQLEKMEAGSLSQHDASVAVGTVLVEKIVKPQLRNAGKQV